jgi:tetratricopeptide (TPR) repeat protein
MEYLVKRDNFRALADFNEAIRLEPADFRTFRYRGDAFRNIGNYNRALADYDEAIRLDPKYAEAFCSRGLVKLKINNEVGGKADHHLNPAEAKGRWRGRGASGQARWP